MNEKKFKSPVFISYTLVNQISRIIADKIVY